MVNIKKDDIVKQSSTIPDDSLNIFRVLRGKLDGTTTTMDKLGINSLKEAVKDDYPKMKSDEFDVALNKLIEEEYINVDDGYFTINNRSRLENVF